MMTIVCAVRSLRSILQCSCYTAGCGGRDDGLRAYACFSVGVLVQFELCSRRLFLSKPRPATVVETTETHTY